MVIIPTKIYSKTCPVCEKEFAIENNAQVYCSAYCKHKRQRSKKADTDWRKNPKTCKVCEKEFVVPENSSPIRKYCSEECQVKGYAVHSRHFRKANPDSMAYYNARRRAKYGNHDTVIIRLYKKYKDLPTCCEAEGCNEGRVIDIAHKPAFRRYGAHRVMKYYERHMFWILCPTHHAIIDRGVLTPAEIGLIE